MPGRAAGLTMASCPTRPFPPPFPPLLWRGGNGIQPAFRGAYGVAFPPFRAYLPIRLDPPDRAQGGAPPVSFSFLSLGKEGERGERYSKVAEKLALCRSPLGERGGGTPGTVDVAALVGPRHTPLRPFGLARAGARSPRPRRDPTLFEGQPFGSRATYSVSVLPPARRGGIRGGKHVVFCRGFRCWCLANAML